MAVIRNRGANARNVSQKIWLSAAEAQAVKDRADDAPVAAWLRDLAQLPQFRSAVDFFAPARQADAA